MEQQLNQHVNTFSRNYNLLYRGDNVCEEQLGHNGLRRMSDSYTLCEEYWCLLKVFVRHN